MAVLFTFVVVRELAPGKFLMLLSILDVDSSTKALNAISSKPENISGRLKLYSEVTKILCCMIAEEHVGTSDWVGWVSYALLKEVGVSVDILRDLLIEIGTD